MTHIPQVQADALLATFTQDTIICLLHKYCMVVLNVDVLDLNGGCTVIGAAVKIC